MAEEALACRALLNQANVRWPKRSKASDGILPSRAHTTQNPTSDHEKGEAADITHDPVNGPDMRVEAERLRVRCKNRDERRVKYLIFNRQIASADLNWAWRRYSGSNPHTTHLHVSIVASARDDDGTWWPTNGASEEDDMALSDDDIKKVAAAVYEAVHKDFVAVIRGADQPSLKLLHSKIDYIKAAVDKP